MRSRPKALRVSGRILTISLLGDALLRQLAVVGGNKTGVFVHQVTEGTAAHAVGISPGAQIVEVGFSTLILIILPAVKVFLIILSLCR